MPTKDGNVGDDTAAEDGQDRLGDGETGRRGDGRPGPDRGIR